MAYPSDSSVGLLSVSQEGRLLWRLRGTVMRCLLQQALATSRLRTAIVAILSIVLWAAIFGAFWECFRIVDQTVAHKVLRIQVIHAVFNLFFLALLFMLTFSSAVISYGLLYRNEEVKFLLTVPIRCERLVFYKFQETAAVSCWGFLLLSTPMLLAYGVVVTAPWYYYVLMVPFAVTFALSPAALGTILCMLLIRYVPTARGFTIVLVVAGIFAAAVAMGWSVFGGTNHDLMTPMWFQDTLDRLKHSEHQLLPSWWLSSGLLEAAHPIDASSGARSWQQSLGFLAVLTSNALLMQTVLGWVGGRCFVTGYSRVAGATKRRRRALSTGIDVAFVRAAIIFPRSMRLLLLKDLRLFRRDPVQWSQFLIFFGLLALYFLNVRRFQYGEALLLWMSVIGFLNVAVVGLILSTFTTRFIFPMISLEGRQFWILGALPVARDDIIWSKFLFACTISLVPCASLILISDVVLNIVQRTPTVALLHQLTCWVLSIGLSALAVGLGARLPNLRHSSPAKIASGFGGTLNLVLSVIFIVLVTLATAVPCCLWVSRTQAPPQRSALGQVVGADALLGSVELMLIGVCVTATIGVAVTIFSLRMGFRAFRELQF